MAISNDSFGSPGLGEGIGLQGTLKDYTPLIAKSRLAEQAMASKAAQKKLDAQLAEEEKLNQDLSKYKVFGAGIPAFTPAYKKISDDFMKTVQELKSKPGVPITSRIEYLQAKSKAQQEFDKLRFQEDALLPALKAAQTIDPKKQKVNTKLLNAYLDDTGESLKSQYGKIGLANEPLITDIPQYNYFKDFGTITKSVVPKKSGTYTPVNIGGREGIQYTKDSEFTQQDIDNGWNRLKSTASYLNNLDETAKLMAGPNATQDVIDNYKNIVEKQEEDAFRAQFKNSTITTASTLPKIDQYGPGGDQPGKDINISYTDNAGDQVSFIRPIAEGLAEKRIKEEFDKYKKGETLDFFESIGLGKDDESRKSVTYDKFKLKIDKYNSTQSDDAMKIGDVDRIIGLLSRTAQLSKYNNRPGINVVRTNAPQNKDFKGVKDSKGKEMEAAFMSYIPADNAKKLPAVFLVLRNDGGGNYTVTEVPASDYNKSVYATEFRIDPKAENNNFDYWFGKKKSDYESGRGGTSIGKAYRDGGLIEPKTVSQKFHNKSKNMTKFVYSDGSEEIFNGIL